MGAKREREMQFAATVDADEIDLINAVAKEISPSAFYYGEYVGTAEDNKIAKACDEANRQRARDIAVEVIRIVKEHLSRP